MKLFIGLIVGGCFGAFLFYMINAGKDKARNSRKEIKMKDRNEY